MTPRSEDVEVIGAGVVGLSIAIVLAGSRCPVTLWTSGAAGDGASAAAQGQLVAPADPTLVPLWQDSLAFYDLFMSSVPMGNMVLATSSAEGTALAQRRPGRLSGAELRAHDPVYGDDVVLALWQDHGRYIVAPTVTARLAAVAAQRGVCTRAGHHITELRRGSRGGWRLAGAALSGVEHRTLVRATGSRTGELCDGLGYHVPMTGYRGRILYTEPLPADSHHRVRNVGAPRCHRRTHRHLGGPPTSGRCVPDRRILDRRAPAGSAGSRRTDPHAGTPAHSRCVPAADRQRQDRDPTNHPGRPADHRSPQRRTLRVLRPRRFRFHRRPGSALLLARMISNDDFGSPAAR